VPELLPKPVVRLARRFCEEIQQSKLNETSFGIPWSSLSGTWKFSGLSLYSALLPLQLYHFAPTSKRGSRGQH